MVKRSRALFAMIGAALSTCALGACAAVLDLPPLELIDGEGGSAQEGGGPGAEGSTDAFSTEASCSPAGLDVDPKNCGRCGHICPGSCEKATCTPFVLAVTADAVTEIAVTASDVFFTTIDNLNQNGTIDRCAKSGCNQTPTKLLTTMRPSSLSADATNVAWLSSGITNNQSYVCALPACTPVPLPALGAQPSSIVLVDTRVVWTDSSDKKLYACPRTGCTTPDTLESSGLQFPSSLRLTRDGASLLWVDAGPIRVVRRALAAGSITTVATPDTNLAFGGLALTSTDAVFLETDFAPGGVVGLRARALDGSGTKRSLTTDRPSGFATDADHVYFSSTDSGSVGRCPTTACPKIEGVATGLVKPSALATDDQFVYVGTAQGVLVLAKP